MYLGKPQRESPKTTVKYFWIQNQEYATHPRIGMWTNVMKDPFKLMGTYHEVI